MNQRSSSLEPMRLYCLDIQLVSRDLRFGKTEKIATHDQ